MDFSDYKKMYYLGVAAKLSQDVDSAGGKLVEVFKSFDVASDENTIKSLIQEFHRYVDEFGEAYLKLVQLKREFND